MKRTLSAATRRLWAFATIAAVALAVASCGGGNAPSGSHNSTSTTGTPSKPASRAPGY